MACFRSDRWGYRGGETIGLEAWVCNDLDSAPRGATLSYQLEVGGQVVQSGRTKVEVPRCGAAVQGIVSFTAPQIDQRTEAAAKIALVDQSGKVLHDNQLPLVLYPTLPPEPGRRVYLLGKRGGTAAALARELGMRCAFSGAIRAGDAILCDDAGLWRKRATEIDRAVRAGATAVLLELPPGVYDVAGDKITIVAGGMGKRHFLSRDTGHPLVEGFVPNEFRFWHDASAGYVTPILETVIDLRPRGWAAILQSGNGSWQTGWQPVPAAIEKRAGKGVYRICQVKLTNRTRANPVAEIFTRRLLAE